MGWVKAFLVCRTKQGHLLLQRPVQLPWEVSRLTVYHSGDSRQVSLMQLEIALQFVRLRTRVVCCELEKSRKVFHALSKGL